MRKPLIASLLTVAAAAGLVSCSSTAPDGGASPSASSSHRAERTPNPTSEVTPPPIEQADVPCDGGAARIEGMNNKEVHVPDCATVVIDSSNAVVHLGATEQLTVNGAINGIDATSLKKVVINGDGNRVTTPSKPKVDDNGSSNTVGR